MKILDMSSGNRAIWFNKNHPDCTYLDIRPEVKPTIVADTRKLPSFVGNNYDLIVFDPPHVNFGKNSNFVKSYGHNTTEEIRSIIRDSAREAHRISIPDALMAFKWNDHDQKLEKVLALMEKYWEPLFGHKTSSRTKHSSQTYWVLLRRKNLEKLLEKQQLTLTL